MTEAGTPSPTSTGGSDPAPSTARRPARPERSWLVPTILVLAALLMVALHVSSYTKLSPIDELQHVDYLYKSPAIVASGDHVGDDAMREEACRGIDYPFPLPPCSATADYRPSDFQELGYNTAAANTPLYYSITHAVAAVLVAMPVIDNLVTAGRLVGGLWLAAGLVMAYAVGRRLRVPATALGAVLLLAAAAPSVLYPSATITPDAAGFAAGAGVLWAALWWEDRPARRWPVLALVMGFAVALKFTNVTVVVAVALYLLLRYLLRWRAARDEEGPTASAGSEPSSRWLLAGVGLAGATTAIVVVAWSVISAAVASGSSADAPMNVRFHVDAFPKAGFLEQIGAFVNPLSTIGVPVGDATLATLSQRFAGLVIVSGVIAAGLFGAELGRLRTLAQGWLVAGLTCGPAFVLLGYVLQSVYFTPPARYAYTLLPGMAVLTASLLRTRPAVVAVAAVALGSVAATVVRLT